MHLHVPLSCFTRTTLFDKFEANTQGEQVECKLTYECSCCRVEKRNKCWALARKPIMKKQLIKGLPYTKDKLGDMTISQLWMLAGYLKVQTVGRTAGELVQGWWLSPSSNLKP